MKRLLLILWLFAGLAPGMRAQYFYGQVTDAKESPIPGAIVAWAGTVIGARCDENGEFAIPLPRDTSAVPLPFVAIFEAARDTFQIGRAHV